MTLKQYILQFLFSEKSQKKAKTTDFNSFLMFSKQWWMDAPDCDYFSKNQYDTNLKNRTTVICFKFRADEKPVSVMPFSNWGLSGSIFKLIWPIEMDEGNQAFRNQH